MDDLFEFPKEADLTRYPHSVSIPQAVDTTKDREVKAWFAQQGIPLRLPYEQFHAFEREAFYAGRYREPENKKRYLVEYRFTHAADAMLFKLAFA